MEKYCNMGKKRTVESLQLSTKSPIFVTKNITAMIHTGERYINPLTDFGFKRIFGTPFNKDLLMSFLNALFNGDPVVSDITYKNSEKFGTNEEARRAVFDVYCTTDTGARIIVEMQNVYQDFYKDRSIYYSTFPIAEQAQRGSWNYELHDVYTIGILNFTFPEDKHSDSSIFREVKLMDTESHEIFYDKLTYIYVELANFHKTLEECDSILEKWIYCLRNLQNLMSRPMALHPMALQGRVFEKLFKTAEIAKMTTEDRRAYELSANAYRDIKNGMDAAKREGMEKGIAIGTEKGIAIGTEKGARAKALEVARKMKARGLEDGMISEMTGLSAEVIKKL